MIPLVVIALITADRVNPDGAAAGTSLFFGPLQKLVKVFLDA